MDPETSKKSNSHNMVALMYFSYTTLSTVGFGDFHPKSDYERLVCIIILLLGVAIFGLIMGDFLEIIDRFNTLDEVIEEGDALSMFFDCLKKRYNYGVDVDPERKQQIEKFFDYKWNNDKN